MNYTTITRYANCDILLHKNDVSLYGFDKNKSEGEMIDLACNRGCSIIIKNGKNGKWYLKGNGQSVAFLKGKINEKVGKSRDGVFCLLLE